MKRLLLLLPLLAATAWRAEEEFKERVVDKGVVTAAVSIALAWGSIAFHAHYTVDGFGRGVGKIVLIYHAPGSMMAFALLIVVAAAVILGCHRACRQQHC